MTDQKQSDLIANELKEYTYYVIEYSNILTAIKIVARTDSRHKALAMVKILYSDRTNLGKEYRILKEVEGVTK